MYFAITCQQCKMLTISVMKKTDLVVAIIILVVSFASRWHVLHNPIADIHTWKQMESYSIIQNYYSRRSSFVSPLRNILYIRDRSAQSAAYRLPLYEYTASLVLRAFGNTLFIIRVYSVFLSASIAWCVYYFGSRYIRTSVGIASALILHAFPGFIYWGSAIMPEIFATTLACLGLISILSKSTSLRLLGALLMGAAIATKIIYIAYIFPVVYWVIMHRQAYSRGLLIAMIIMVSLPFALWQIRISTIPLFERAWPSYQYYAFHNKNIIENILETRWFEVLLKERIFGKLFTPAGGALFLFSVPLLLKRKTINTLMFYWLFGILLSFVVVAWGNYTHEYNQILLFPVAALLMGQGVCSAFIYVRKKPVTFQIILCLVASLFFVWYVGVIPHQQSLKEYYRQEIKYEQFYPDTKNVRAMLPADASIVLLNLYDPQGSESLLYTFERPGWIITELPFCTSESVQDEIQKRNKIEKLFIVINKEPYYFDNDPYPPECGAEKLIEQFAIYNTIVYDGSHMAIIKI